MRTPSSNRTWRAAGRSLNLHGHLDVKIIELNGCVSVHCHVCLPGGAYVYIEYIYMSVCVFIDR